MYAQKFVEVQFTLQVCSFMENIYLIYVFKTKLIFIVVTQWEGNLLILSI